MLARWKKRHVFVIILILVITGCSSKIDGSEFSAQENLAKCLKEKGVVFYGSDRCENCQRQKSLFGEAFAIIDYKNCDFSASECDKKGIKVYPVWSLENRVVLGTQSLKQLAEFANCPYLPADEK